MTTQQVTQENERERILAHLAAFIRQRSGLDPANYISGWDDAEGRRAYRQEQRAITKDLHDARELLAAVSWRTSITAQDLRDAFRAYSGRLSWHAKGDPCQTCNGTGEIHADWERKTMRQCYSCKGSGVNASDRLDYCAGQYFPTEYRKAVCAVLAQALWGYFRANLEGKHDKVEHAGTMHERETFTVGGKSGLSWGDAIRATARRELSRGVASRWFN